MVLSPFIVVILIYIIIQCEDSKISPIITQNHSIIYHFIQNYVKFDTRLDKTIHYFVILEKKPFLFKHIIKFLLLLHRGRKSSSFQSLRASIVLCNCSIGYINRKLMAQYKENHFFFSFKNLKIEHYSVQFSRNSSKDFRSKEFLELVTALVNFFLQLSQKSLILCLLILCYFFIFSISFSTFFRKHLFILYNHTALKQNTITYTKNLVLNITYYRI